MLILLNGGTFSLTVSVHNMLLISFERMCVRGSTHHKDLAEPTRLVVSPTNKTHQTAATKVSPPKKSQGTQLFFTSHSSVQIEGHILRRYHFLIQWPFFLPWRRSKKTLDQPRRQWLLNHQWRHYLTIDSFVSDMSLTCNFLNTNHEVNSKDNSTHPKQTIPIPFERWCNRLSFLSNSCFISSRILHKPFERLFQLICWGFMRPLGYNLSRLRIWLERWCWTDATPSHPKCEYIKSKFHYQSKESTGSNHAKKTPISCTLDFMLLLLNNSIFGGVQSSSLTTRLFSIPSSKFTSLNLYIIDAFWNPG